VGFFAAAHASPWSADVHATRFVAGRFTLPIPDGWHSDELNDGSFQAGIDDVTKGSIVSKMKMHVALPERSPCTGGKMLFGVG
jgi:hypothetical protein